MLTPANSTHLNALKFYIRSVSEIGSDMLMEGVEGYALSTYTSGGVYSSSPPSTFIWSLSFLVVLLHSTFY